MADIAVLCTRFWRFQAPLKGVSGRTYFWKKGGHGIVLALVAEEDVEGILLGDKNYRLATLAEQKLWAG